MAFLRSRRECGKLASVRECKKKYRGPPEIWEKRGRKGIYWQNLHERREAAASLPKK